MLTKWTADCKTPEEKKKREEIVKSYSEVLDILSKVCYNSISELDKAVDYSSPSWAYEQADRLGQIRAYKDVIKMCNLNKDH